MAKASERSGNFQHLFLFLEGFVHAYGEGIEKSAISTLRNTELPVEDDIEFGRMLQDVIVRIVDSAQSSLGGVWTRPKEQRQGQLAFESKSSPPRIETTPNDALAGVFSFTTECLMTCPVFLLHLRALMSQDEHQEDLFVRRVSESAVHALNDTDPEVSRSAMKVLKVAVRLSTKRVHYSFVSLRSHFGSSCHFR